MSEKTDTDFYIVGVGASAGGLEALEKFFTNMPGDSDMAFVVIQHLSPNYKSHMAELLSKYALLDVHEAEDGMPVQPNSIYLIPRGKNMTIFKRKLYLVDYDRGQGLNLPIDIFLQSLAQDQAERAVGIILSGTGSDGTRGIRTIKEMGGMVMAQDESAKFDGMPRSAILTRMVDFITAPEEMPQKLLNYVKHPCLTTDPGVKPVIANDEVTLGKLFALLRNSSGVDFTKYKPNTVLRRIERRMNISQVQDLANYVEYLQHSPQETNLLFKELLIGVTSFFRDTDSYEYLQRKIVPLLYEGRGRGEQIRIWVPGCSTGEEAYSLAIIFREYMEKMSQFIDVKIFATDIDKEALDFASQGIYPESIVADVSSERLQNFFLKKGDTYEILRHVRSMVVFANQNLIQDPPFSKMDLISCRNLLIYLQPVLQKKVLATFQFALKDGGYLFLGNSETVGDYGRSLSAVNNKYKIYQYAGGASPILHLQKARQQTGEEPRKQVSVKGYRQQRPVDDWRSSDVVLRSLVEQVMPPCVVVDENYQVVHAFGDAKAFLQPPTGYRVNLNVLNMVRDELSLPLNTALHRTISEREEVVYRNVKLEEENDAQFVNVITRPFWERGSRQQLVLVVFESVANDNAPPQQSEEFNISQNARQRIVNLEQELQYTKENLQATIEELETANEELQATNEELLAANEELQSTNEELQSVNEEMITVNAEYQAKIRELTFLNNDVNNLLSSTDVGTIFLDSRLKVRRFTPVVQSDVNLLEQDLGRPISHISHNFVGVDLVQEANSVLETLSSIEKEVRSREGRWYIMRVKPYVTHTNQIDGVVITFVDTSARREVVAQLAASNRRLNASMEHHSAILYEQDVTLRYTAVHNPQSDFLDENSLQQTDAHVFPPAFAQQLKAMKERAIKQADGDKRTFRVDMDDQTRYYNVTAEPVFNDEEQVIGLHGAYVDITDAVVNQREQLDLYMLAAQHTPDVGLVTFDDELRCLSATGNFGQGTPSVDLEGEPLLELYSNGSVESLQAAYQAALAGLQRICRFETPNDGVFRVNTLPQRNEEGEVVAGVALFRRL